MTILRHLTYHLGGYGPLTSPADRDRFALVRETIRAVDADVVSVQGIAGINSAKRDAVFRQLVSELGMSCLAAGHVTLARPAFDAGRGLAGVGVMWRPERIEPAAGSVRTYAHEGFEVGMALVRLRVEDRVEITVASTQWRSSYPHRRADEAVCVASEMRDQGLFGIVGGNWNAMYASETADGKEYDSDPFVERVWDPRHIELARPNPDDRAVGLGRREAMRELEDGGLCDPAARLNVPWYRTTRKSGADGPIDVRVDGPMVSTSVVAASSLIAVFDEEPAHHASPHLPVVYELDLDVMVADVAAVAGRARGFGQRVRRGGSVG